MEDKEGQRGRVLYVTFSNINNRQETMDLGIPDTPVQDKQQNKIKQTIIIKKT